MSQPKSARPALTKILKSSYLNEKNLSKDEIVLRLRNVSEALRDIEVPSKDSRSLSNALVSQTFIRHRDREVKVIVACCLADIMRIYAPEAPFDGKQIKTVFTFFVAQLRGLESPSGPSFSRYFYLLERLALVKAFIVITDFENDDLMIDLFQMFFEIIKEEHSHKVFSHMVDILSACIEESDTVSANLLDKLLENLLPPLKQENPPAYRLAQGVINQAQGRLEPFLASFLNGVINSGKSGESELADQVYGIIFEVNQISSSLLLHVLPNLVNELRMEDVGKRKEAVKLLGRMFAAKGSSLGTSYTELFNEFLKRFCDMDSGIRLMMVAFAKHFLLNQPDLAGAIKDILLQRVQDNDEKMRRAVVTCIIDAAMSAPDCVDQSLLEAATFRTRDKKVTLRREATLKVAQLYQHHNSERENWSDFDQAKFGGLPNVLMHTFWVTEDPLFTRQKLHEILEEYIIPSQNLAKRALALMNMFEALDEKGVQAFSQLLSEKQVFQKIMAEFIQLRRSLSKAKKDEEIKKKLIVKGDMLAARLPPLSKLSGHDALVQFSELRDNRIFDRLAVLCQPSCTQTELKQATEEVHNRVGSKSPIIEYVKMMTSKLNAMCICSDVIPVIMKEIDERLKRNDPKAMTLLGLLETIAQSFPSRMIKIHSQFTRLLTYKVETVVTIALKIIKATGTLLSSDKVVMSSLRKQLPKICVDGTPVQAKLAVQCIAAVLPEDSSIFRELVETLVAKLSKDDPVRLGTVLKALGHVALLSSDMFLEHAEEVINFVVKDVLLSNEDADVDQYDDESGAFKGIKILAIKLLVKYLLPLEGHVRDAAAEPGFKLLLKLIENDGQLSSSTLTSTYLAKALKMTAACGILKLCTKPSYEAMLTPQKFILVAWVAQDEEFEVRAAFLSKIDKYLKGYVLPQRFAAILPLFALDPETENVTKARTALHTYGRQRREALLKAGTQAIPEMRKIAIMPEYTVPYLIHTLSHRADFPDVEDFDFDYTPFTKILNFHFGELVRLGNNISFMVHLLDTIKQCRDAIENDSLKMHFLCDLASHIVRRKGEGKVEDAVFPGEIRLPRSLFVRAADATNLGSRSFLPPGFKLGDRTHRALQFENESPIKSPSDAKSPSSSMHKRTPSSKLASKGAKKSRSSSSSKARRGRKPARRLAEQFVAAENRSPGSIGFPSSPLDFQESTGESEWTPHSNRKRTAADISVESDSDVDESPSQVKRAKASPKKRKSTSPKKSASSPKKKASPKKKSTGQAKGGRKVGVKKSTKKGSARKK